MCVTTWFSKQKTKRTDVAFSEDARSLKIVLRDTGAYTVGKYMGFKIRSGDTKMFTIT